VAENSVTDRLQAADPAAGLEPYDEAELRRRIAAITAALEPQPRRRRPAPRRPTRRMARLALVAGAAACATAAVLALLPAGQSRRLPGPVEALAAQLTRPGAIVHFVSDARLMHVEAWIALDGSASRELSSLGPGADVMESVVHDGRAAAYSQRDNRLIRYGRVKGRGASGLCWPCLVVNLRRSVRHGVLRPAGETVVDGRPADILRLSGRLPTRLYVARVGGALLRIELDTERGTIREDFRTFEVLDGTPAHRRLLEMAPHPGARVVDKPRAALP
jgi:hypothetical protein